jgi:hypothetical protein
MPTELEAMERIQKTANIILEAQCCRIPFKVATIHDGKLLEVGIENEPLTNSGE